MCSNPFTNEWKEIQEFQKSFNKIFGLGEQQEETDTSSLFFEMNLINKNEDEQSYPNINLDEISSIFENYTPIFEPVKAKIFKVVHRERTSLFTNLENDEIDSSTNDETFLKRKRLPEKRRRLENQDNMRKKIKRGFLNNALIIKLNDILEYNKIKSYFEKFPQNLVTDVTRNSNKDLLNMSLEEIFEKKELYNKNDKNSLNNYYHNLEVIKSKEVQENSELKKSKEVQENSELKTILNKKYFELFEEYINSKEFKVDENNRLKKKKMNDLYIERYICLAKHLIEFFSE